MFPLWQGVSCSQIIHHQDTVNSYEIAKLSNTDCFWWLGDKAVQEQFLMSPLERTQDWSAMTISHRRAALLVVKKVWQSTMKFNSLMVLLLSSTGIRAVTMSTYWCTAPNSVCFESRMLSESQGRSVSEHCYDKWRTNKSVRSIKQAQRVPHAAGLDIIMKVFKSRWAEEASCSF